MNFGLLIATIFVNPIINLLVLIYQALLALHVPYALGFAIILLTVVFRFVLYPFTASQLKASRKMQKVAPHIRKLKEKHKDDHKMLQAETMRLYQEHGINPLASCLPVLIQLPFLFSLYHVLQKVVGANGTAAIKELNDALYSFVPHISKLDQNFFGLPLGKSPGDLLEKFGFLILLIPISTAVFQFFQTKMMYPSKDEEPQEEGEKKKDDFASAMQTQSLYIFPLMIGFFAFQFPVGLSLYWNTFTIFGMIQQYQLSGLGGLKDLLNKKQ